MKLPKYMQKNAGPITVVTDASGTFYTFTDDEGEHWHEKHPDGDYDPKITIKCGTCLAELERQFPDA